MDNDMHLHTHTHTHTHMHACTHSHTHTHIPSVVEYLESISEQVSGMDSSGERDNEQVCMYIYRARICSEIFQGGAMAMLDVAEFVELEGSIRMQ